MNIEPDWCNNNGCLATQCGCKEQLEKHVEKIFRGRRELISILQSISNDKLNDIIPYTKDKAIELLKKIENRTFWNFCIIFL